MSLVSSRRDLAALTFPLLVALACSGEVLAPADGVACTRGRLDTSAPKFGEISTESCLLWSDWEYEQQHSESWTLDLKAHSAYVIRLVPVDAAGDTSSWNGDLGAYARNRAGDAVFGATWETFVNGNPRTRELVIVSDRDREVSVRVDSYDTLSLGAYRLEVQRCAARTIADGDTIPDIQVDGGCTVSNLNGSVAEVAFLTYRVASLRDPNITVERTAGDGTLRPQIGGPDLDIFGNLGDGILQVATPTTTSAILDPGLDFPGTYTIVVGVTPGTTATMRVSVDKIPAQP